MGLYRVVKFNIMPGATLIQTGSIVEIDDKDPRVPLWLADGSIMPEAEHIGQEDEEREPVKRGRPPKSKE